MRIGMRNRKIFALTLLIIFVTSMAPIQGVKGEEILGTNLALGSPLLNNNFNNDSWDKWETIAFGVFLSNFTYPLVDDYASAFSNTNRGSKGSGFAALNFGTGSDPANNEVLKSLLDYSISMQIDTRNLKEIVVREETFEKSVGETNKLEKTGETTGYRKATINDLLSEDLKTTKFMSATRYNLPTFSVKTGKSEESGYTTIFSYTDGWDVQMLAAWMARVTLGDFRKEANKNLDSLLDNNAELYMDVFGNIVTIMEGQQYIILPASSNQYITKDKRYNLLTSVIFGGNYITTNANNLVDYMEVGKNKVLFWDAGYKGKDSSSASVNKYIKAGSTVVTYDSALSSLLYSNEDQNRFGKAIADVLTADINRRNTNMGFTIDVIGLSDLKEAHDTIRELGESLILLSNVFPTDSSRIKLTSLKMANDRINIFDKPIATGVMIDGADNDKNFNAKFARRFVNYIQGIIHGGNDLTIYNENIRSENIINTIVNSTSTLKVGENLINTGGHITPLMESFIKINSNNKDSGALFTKEGGGKSLGSVRLSEIDKAGYKKRIDNKDPKLSESKTSEAFYRVVKAYPINDTIRQLSNVLSVRPGTEFGLMSPYIYMTYLDFYGVTGGRQHNFNTNIFDAESDLLKVDITKATAGNVMNEEDMKARVLEYSYIMLDPEKGREYRSNIMMNNINDWIYRTYQNIVHGKAVKYNSGESGIQSRQSLGFLHVDSYSENFTTAWFMEGYSKYLLIIVGVSIVAIIVVGVVNRRKVFWMLATSLLVVTALILTPAIGEITPYVSNSLVSGMFKDKMSYWTISESITNSNMEKAEYRTLEATADEASLSELVKMLNIAYLDRSLVIKNDISKKITETQLKDYEEIQKLQSARWMLPTLIRQFSSNDKTANYLYVPIADAYDNLSNSYWYYKPGEAINVKNRAAYDIVNNFNEGEAKNKTDIHTKSLFYPDYIDTSNMGAINKGMYNQLGFEKVLRENVQGADNSGVTGVSDIPIDYSTSPGWESLSRIKDDSEVVHTGSYILKDLRIPALDVNIEEGRGLTRNKNYYKDVWKEYVENNINNNELINELETLANWIEQGASSYDSRNPSSSLQDYYGYLWHTESTLHYFYQVVKDTFEPGVSVAVIAGELQGTYENNSRQTIMHYRDTGFVRDFLDIQELITNVLPYLYKVQILAGGTDGKSGILTNKPIELYSLYDFLDKSWLFRSNWATKLMTSDDLNRSTIVTDKNGVKHHVNNPLIASEYPDERPMVFSEAQMYAQGLSHEDLSIVELKILRVNDKVVDKWTNCLNYVNIPGVTPETLYRQMATDATIEFNREFSDYNKITNTRALYPDGIDLRGISFDSIMTMLMLNTTRDSKYIYGDTMKNIIENSDIFSSILLLLIAFICSFLIPLVRNVLLGAIFFLGIWALLGNILTGGKMKLKITTAYIINNLLFLGMTFLYYLIFSVIVNSSYRDDVLNVGNVGVSVGAPTWIFIIICLISILYILGALAMIGLVTKNYRDLGFEVYAAWGGVLADRIRGGIPGGMVGGILGGLGVGKATINNIDLESKNVTVNEKNKDIDMRSENYSTFEYDMYDVDDEEYLGRIYDEVQQDIDNQIEKGKGAR